MKKILLFISLVLAVVLIETVGRGQSSVIPAQVSTVTNFPTVTFTGADAQVIAVQLLSITNASGRVVAPSAVTNKPAFTVIIRITNTNGVPKSITTLIR